MLLGTFLTILGAFFPIFAGVLEDAYPKVAYHWLLSSLEAQLLSQCLSLSLGYYGALLFLTFEVLYW